MKNVLNKYLFELILINCILVNCISIGSFTFSFRKKGSNGNRPLDKLYAKNDRPIAILGAPFWRGQKISGTELAPQCFRNQSIVKQIKRLGYDSVVDYGDLDFKVNPKDESTLFRNNFTQINNQFTLSDANLMIMDRVEKSVRKGETLLVLGGDHSVTAGSILGNAKVNSDICVLYVNAHGDINTCETTQSGNLHGAPLSFVIKEMEKLQNNFSSCPAMKALKPLVSASAVALISTRDLDDLELNLINELKVKHYSMKDIDDIGMEDAVNQILSSVCKSKSKIHVSFDIDSLDATYAPNTGATVPGGLTIREALLLAEIIASTKKLNVLEMYEVNPLLKPQESAHQTVNVALNIVLSFLGKSREVYWAQPWEGGWEARKDIPAINSSMKNSTLRGISERTTDIPRAQINISLLY